MEIDNSLKDNLIADVENILAITLSNENTELLKRCFEITIGHAISELSRLKSEGEDFTKPVLSVDKITDIKPAEQSDKSIISATNDNPFGAVKELAEQTKNDVEVDSDVKIYNERQDLQAQFRKPAKQSDKLTAEEWKQKLCGYIEKSLKSAHLKDGENHLVDILSAGPTIQEGIEEIENIVEQIYFDMESYASQFVGEKVTDEIIDKYYPTVETGAYNSMNFARQEGAKALRDGKIK